MDTQRSRSIKFSIRPFVLSVLSLIRAQLYRSMVAFKSTSLANFPYEIYYQTICKATNATSLERVEAGYVFIG